MPDVIDEAVGAAPDQTLVDIGADEVSVLHGVVKACSGVSALERRRLAVIDATLAKRLSQFHVTSTGVGT
jgi:hypothetical protein